MEEVLSLSLNEYGLILTGYSGSDESIMKIFNKDGVQIPDYGIYWCTLDKDSLSEPVERLLEKPNTFLVEIEGFEDMMTEIYNELGDLTVPLPKEINDRADKRAEMLEEKLENIKDTSSSEETEDISQVNQIRSALKYEAAEQYDEALNLIEDAILMEDSDTARMARGNILRAKGDYESAIDDFTKIIDRKAKPYQAYLERGVTNSHAGNYEQALQDYQNAFNGFEDESFKKVKLEQNLAEVNLMAGYIEEGRKHAKESLENANNSIESKISEMLLIIADILDGEEDHKDIKNNEIQLKQDDVYWSFEDLNNWLESADINKDKKEKIQNVMGQFSENTTS